MPRFLLIIAIQLCSYCIAAQEEYNIQFFTTENGLPSNGIKGMQWDPSTGFLWLATEAGVVRFDGLNFKIFNKETHPELSSERMLFLVRNHEGRIFTADQEGHVFMVEANELVFRKDLYQGSSSKPNNYLLATTQKILSAKYRTTLPINVNLSYDRIINQNDTLSYVFKGGMVYAIGLNGFRDIKATSNKRFHGLFKIGEKALIIDLNQNIYILSADGATLSPTSIVDETGHAIKIEANDLVYWDNGMKNPVLLKGEKAWLLDYGSDVITAELIADNIPGDSYLRAAQYSEENKMLLLGTESKGLIVIRQNRVRSVRKHNAGFKERNSYYGQLELSNGNILTSEGHIIGDSKQQPDHVPINGKFSYSVFRFNKTELWFHQGDSVSNENILYKYDESTKTTTTFKNIRPSGNMALTMSDGRMYISHDKGIGIITRDSIIEYIHYYPPDSYTITYTILEAKPGLVFIATCYGLYQLDTKSNKVTEVPELKDYCVRSLWKYNDYVFIGTYGMGYSIWKNGVIKDMPLDKNKFLLYTHCFIPDDYGFVWISTNRGLFKAKLDGLIGQFENPDNQAYYHYIGKNDGMVTTEMNGGCNPCALMLKNKSISFPTMDGLLWVTPSSSTISLPTGDIFIDNIYIDGEKSDSVDFSRLSAKTNEIRIKLSMAAWTNRENIYIDYKLNDAANWKRLESDDNFEIRFQNLPSGDYNLRIRKLNGFGKDNYSYKDFKFSIITPWFNRWWTYALAGLVLGGLFYFFYKFRTRQYVKAQLKLEKQISEKTKELKEKNEVLEKADVIKTRLISIISHDIITPLRFVSVAGKKLIDKESQMPKELQEETIQEITNTAGELQLLSTNILNWIKYQNENRRLVKENFSIAEVGDQVLSVLRPFANQKKLKLVNEIDKDLEIFQFCEPLKIVVYNLVSNAINFTEHGEIRLVSRQIDDELLLSVRDQGTGMTEEQISNIMSDEIIISSANIDNRKGNGLGYLIIKDLVKMMDAKMFIESKKGKGTEVTILMNPSRSSG